MTSQLYYSRVNCMHFFECDEGICGKPGRGEGVLKRKELEWTHEMRVPSLSL